MTDFRIDLSDPTLFGNDVAEDESDAVFDAYFLHRKEIDLFLNPTEKLRVLSAYRGEGKSAILRRAAELVKKDQAVSVSVLGSALAPHEEGDALVLARAWKRNILKHLASEIGARIGMAWSDDAMALVELAEQGGFKEQNIVSAIVDRIRTDKVTRERLPADADKAEHVLRRHTRPDQACWFFVDDLDENFENTAEVRKRIAAFFSAARDIANKVPGIRIRACIRPNIWTIVRLEEESLSKVDQYVLTVGWDRTQMRALLAKRIEGYLRRVKPDVLSESCPLTGASKDERLIEYAFVEQMEWGYNKVTGKPKHRHPWVIISTLSRLRPRWMIELAKVAADAAVADSSRRIELKHITGKLKEFGRKRIFDLSAEYRSLCPNIRDMINAFSGCGEDYPTDVLIDTIKRRILPGIPMLGSWFKGKASPKDVAALLFEIGFLTARRDLGNSKYEHLSFAEDPELLHSRSNIDKGMSWEIHPVFRQALGLRRADGSIAKGLPLDDIFDELDGE